MIFSRASDPNTGAGKSTGANRRAKKFGKALPTCLDFTPHAGTEQGGRRPGLVISHREHDVATRLAFVRPVTSRSKDSPFEVRIPPGRISGVVLANQLRSLDWIERNELVEDVAGIIAAIME